ncbi:hypothetical protein DFP94_1011357 [Fontibacillus phaseoli]|uniref:Uncharacterized protein n=1 Tax=Fontibacillus phaseoli TaxID=1416533 RepID=A0A369BRS9_9BACL|nr:hypothetical protein [Fontibacillus phaseoli]RCX23755.1 hypothetical protein DFP94_1011357 [Fontibacillus phaseoli]
MKHHDKVLVFAPNQAGERFVQDLSESGGSPNVMACNSAEQLFAMKQNLLIKPQDMEFSKAFVFEEELDQCCKVLEIITKWMCGTIYVITRKHYPQMIYRALGADYVIRTTSEDLSFLMDKRVDLDERRD